MAPDSQYRRGVFFSWIHWAILAIGHTQPAERKDVRHLHGVAASRRMHRMIFIPSTQCVRPRGACNVRVIVNRAPRSSLKRHSPATTPPTAPRQLPFTHDQLTGPAPSGSTTTCSARASIAWPRAGRRRGRGGWRCAARWSASSRGWGPSRSCSARADVSATCSAACSISTCRRPARGAPRGHLSLALVAGAPGRRRSAGWSRACSSSPGRPRGRGARHRRPDPRLPPRRRADPGAGPADQGGRLDHHDRHRRLGRAGGADRADRRRVRVVPGAAPPAHARRAPAADAGRARPAGIGAIFRAPLGGALFAGEVLYSTDGHRVGRAAALPGQLDRRLLDVRPVHHAPADLHRARPGLPRPARAAAVRRAGGRLRGGRLAVRAGLLRPARPRLPPPAAPPARQAGARAACCWGCWPWPSRS